MRYLNKKKLSKSDKTDFWWLKKKHRVVADECYCSLWSSLIFEQVHVKYQVSPKSNRLI